MIHLTRTTPPPSLRGSAVLATILVLLTVVSCSVAGFWQLRRAHYKDDLQAKAELAMRDAPIELSASASRLEDIEWRTIHVRGEWLADKTVFLDNKIRDGVVGYQVLTPLRIATGKLHVLVNRGWIAAPPLRSELPRVTTPAGMVEISGIARAPSDRFLELSRQNQEGSQGQVWQNLTVERFQAWSGLALQPVVIFQQNPGGDQLRREAVAPEASGLSADRHRGYAMTWFVLAGVPLLLAVAAALKSSRHEAET